MTILESKNKMLHYILQAYKKGVAVPAATNADFLAMHNLFSDTVQMEIANLVGIPETYEVTQSPIENLLGSISFDMKAYDPDKGLVYTKAGGKSYYIEMDNVGTCVVAVNGVAVDTISNTVKRAFTAYKGNTGASSTDTVTITFSGSYPYNVRNIALYKYPFATDADVPDFTAYNTYTMPADFLRFDAPIIQKGDPRLYRNYVAYGWEKVGKVILNSFDKGSFTIPYFRKPTQITASSLDTVPFDVKPEAAELIPLKIAYYVVREDKAEIAIDLLNEFEKQLARVVNAPDSGGATVQTIYSME
jgi:hypothetical protein